MSGIIGQGGSKSGLIGLPTIENSVSDYEEGLHQVTFTTGGGSASLYAATDSLSYTKIGNRVFITGQLIVDTPSSATGTITVTLPFTSADHGGEYGAEKAAGFIYTASLHGGGNITGHAGWSLNGNDSTLDLVDVDTSAAGTPLFDLANHLEPKNTTDHSYFKFSFNYEAA